jgi:hypothetical protein
VKTFRCELSKFRIKLEGHEAFAFSRYGDGELGILRNELIDDIEYKNDPEDTAYLQVRRMLLESLRYTHEQYYVGISCPHCIGEDDFNWLRRISQQDDEHLTFACLFVNSNYSDYTRHLLPLFGEYEVVLVCNREASTERLPFHVRNDFRIGMNAWKDDQGVVDEIKKYIEASSVEGSLFLFCAGPFGCLLAHQLHSLYPNNTYLDVGSTLDLFLFGSATRGYLAGAPDLAEECIWT